VSNQSIPLTVKGVVAYKVGDDLASIANAARRFLDQDANVMQATIHELFAGSSARHRRWHDGGGHAPQP